MRILALVDLNDLIRDKVQESIHLDYKASQALSFAKNHKELAKDVSAFANSDGGIIVYGMKEDGHLPIELDNGVPLNAMNKERLENIVTSNIAPHIDGLVIRSIQAKEDNYYYVIEIPKSYRGPHQDRGSYRYYRRYNFKSVPMEDYEIEDLRIRSGVEPPLINIQVEISQDSFFELTVENIGTSTATDLEFKFSTMITWPRGSPEQLTNGIKYLSPGKKLAFFFGLPASVFKEERSSERVFTVDCTYRKAETGRVLTDTFYIDLDNLKGTSIIKSDLLLEMERSREQLKNLVNGLTKLNDHLKQIRSICAPSGLRLSYSTLENLRSVVEKRDLRPLHVSEPISILLLQEVLNITIEEAQEVRNALSKGDEHVVEKMSPKLKEKLLKVFDLDSYFLE